MPPRARSFLGDSTRSEDAVWSWQRKFLGGSKHDDKKSSKRGQAAAKDKTINVEKPASAPTAFVTLATVATTNQINQTLSTSSQLQGHTPALLATIVTSSPVASNTTTALINPAPAPATAATLTITALQTVTVAPAPQVTTIPVLGTVATIATGAPQFNTSTVLVNPSPAPAVPQTLTITAVQTVTAAQATIPATSAPQVNATITLVSTTTALANAPGPSVATVAVQTLATGAVSDDESSGLFSSRVTVLPTFSSSITLALGALPSPIAIALSDGTTSSSATKSTPTSVSIVSKHAPPSSATIGAIVIGAIAGLYLVTYLAWWFIRRFRGRIDESVPSPVPYLANDAEKSPNVSQQSLDLPFYIPASMQRGGKDDQTHYYESSDTSGSVRTTQDDKLRASWDSTSSPSLPIYSKSPPPPPPPPLPPQSMLPPALRDPATGKYFTPSTLTEESYRYTPSLQSTSSAGAKMKDLHRTKSDSNSSTSP